MGDSGSQKKEQYKGEYSATNNYFSSVSENTEEEIDFKKIISLLLHQKYLILSIVVVCVCIAFFLAHEAIPIYQSDGTILITNANQNSYSMASSSISNILTNVYGIGSGNDVVDEIQILESRTLSKDIARELLKKKYEPDGRLYPILWKDYPKDSTLVSVDKIAARIRGSLTISSVTEGGQQSDVINITCTGYNPYEAADIVNLTISSFSKLSTEQNRKMASSALLFLKNESKRIKASLELAEKKLQRFMNHSKLVDLSDQSQQLVQTLTQLETNREELQVNRVATNTAIKTYTAQLDSLRPGLPKQYAEALAPTLTRYQYRLAELQTKKMLLFSRNPGITAHTDSIPELSTINRQIRMLKGQISHMTSQLVDKDNLRYLGFLGTSTGDIGTQVVKLEQNLIKAKIEKKQYDAEAQVLNKQVTRLNAFFDQLPNNMIKLARHKMEVSINKQLYITVDEQAADMALWEQTQGGQSRVIDYGNISNLPIKPRKKLYLLIGLMFGLIISTGYIFVKESFVTEINSIKDLSKNGYPPLLSIIPDMTNTIKRDFSGQKFVTEQKYKVNTSLLTLLDSISPVAESFRRLQSNIIYSQPDVSLKTLVITSAGKAEGKTILTGNLGVALAESGKKVLIMDCDFRRPRQHSLFGVSNEQGLMDVLFDKCEVSNAIKETILPNVHVIPVGKRSPNPAAISQSSKLRDLINSLKESYDCILIDTAPYGIINDAAPLIKMADGVIISVRFNVTKVSNINQTLVSLDQINAKIIGTVMQAFDYSKSSDYYYYGKGYYKYSYYHYNDYHHERDDDQEELL